MPSASGATYRGRDARAPLGCVAWCVLGIFAFSWGAHAAAAEEKPAREIITQAILVTNQAEKRKLITSLEGRGDDVIVTLFDAWRADELFVYTPQDGEKRPYSLPARRTRTARARRCALGRAASRSARTRGLSNALTRRSARRRR